jgi:hypothetical protein
MNDKLHKISDIDLTYHEIQKLYASTLDEIAPLRVIRIREGQLANSKIEALKKRRNRYLRKFKKTQDVKHLEIAKSLSAKIKKNSKN